MAAQIVKQQAARWTVIVPWQRGETVTDLVAAELTTSGSELTVSLIGSKPPITFPLERAKMLLDALREAIAYCEAANVPTA